MFPSLKKILRFLALTLALAGPGLFGVPGLFVGKAWAADPPFKVSGVHVEANGASSTEAYNTALADGRPKAWATLFRRLTQQKDWARQPELDAATLIRISRGYTVANERRSTTRYLADVTYSFNPDAVARLLQSQGIAYSQGAARKTVIVPMSPNFSLNAWAQALNTEARTSVVPFSMAESADVAGLKDVNFDNASFNDVAAAARRANAPEVALVQVVSVPGKLVVNVRRLGAGESPVKTSMDVPLVQNPGATYPAAATAAINAIEDMWKSRSAIDYTRRGTLIANVRMDSLAQWGAIQNALAGVDNITNVTVNAMDIGYAQVSIAFTGSSDQLREVLSDAGLQLAPVRGQSTWTLAMNGGPP
jgi:hypothetical protein